MKLALIDIDGFILPADPDRNLPYMKRLARLVELAELKRGAPINWDLMRADNVTMEDTTDLGYALKLLHPTHKNPFTEPTLSAEETRRLNREAMSIVDTSVYYYLDLVKNSNIVYTPNPGIKELLNRLKKDEWKMVIASGNPFEVAEDKIKRAGLMEFFASPEEGNSLFNPWYSRAMQYGDRAYRRDDIITDYLNQFPQAENVVYLGDRLSDVGVIERNSEIRGIIHPSFPRWLLKNTYYQTFQDSGRLLYVRDFSPTSIEHISSFMERSQTNTERIGPRRKEFA